MGISYLDMGDAFMRADWQTALNGLWSPLYAIPLGLVTTFFKPSVRWEFPLVHLINFFIFVGALFAFDFFLRRLVAWKNVQLDSTNKESTGSVPDWAIELLAYALFLWSSLGLITIQTTAPDLLMSIFVYLAFGFLLRIDQGDIRWKPFLLLGITVGLGYLAKAPMLPLGILFILVALLLTRSWRLAGQRFSVALLGLLLLAGPFIVALSISKNRITYGDSSTLNYAWHINQVPFFHWQGDAIHGTPKHPTRKIFDQPAVYEFGAPILATYPPWYDSSYWYDGVTPRFNLAQHKRAALVNLKGYWELFTFGSHLTLMAGFVVLLFISRRNALNSFRSIWKLLIIPVAALALFLPVHVEPRYVAAFITPLWLFLFASLRPENGEQTKKRVSYLIIVVASLIILAQAGRSVTMAWAKVSGPSVRPIDQVQLEMADELIRRGLRPGDAIGLINYNPFWLPIVHWARLARLRVVAELPNTEAAGFSAADESVRREVIAAFARTGAKAVVADFVPDNVELAGWERIGETRYYVLKLGQP
jgi:hypothetical protein